MSQIIVAETNQQVIDSNGQMVTPVGSSLSSQASQNTSNGHACNHSCDCCLVPNGKSEKDDADHPMDSVPQVGEP